MNPEKRPLAAWVAAVLLAGAALALPAAAATAPAETDGVRVGEKSRVANLVSAEKIEREAAGQYAQLLRDARSRDALAPDGHPQVQRLRRIAAELIPNATRFNPRAAQWKWEVNLIGSKQVNAFCMPGGKIAFFSGIIDTLKLTDDEIATVMGHEIAHALREHGRERAAKSGIATGVTFAATIASHLLGWGDAGRQIAGAGSQLALLSFSRGDETEADVVGMDLAARAGYDPRAGIKLWEKMAAVSKGQPPQWLSTHPSHSTRVADIRKHLTETLPLYAKAKGTDVASLPPYRSNYGEPVR